MHWKIDDSFNLVQDLLFPNLSQSNNNDASSDLDNDCQDDHYRQQQAINLQDYQVSTMDKFDVFKKKIVVEKPKIYLL